LTGAGRDGRLLAAIWLTALAELPRLGWLIAMVPPLSVYPPDGTFTAAAVRALAAGWLPGVVTR
jgi:hypothetical protein